MGRLKRMSGSDTLFAYMPLTTSYIHASAFIYNMYVLASDLRTSTPMSSRITDSIIFGWICLARWSLAKAFLLWCSHFINLREVHVLVSTFQLVLRVYDTEALDYHCRCMQSHSYCRHVSGCPVVTRSELILPHDHPHPQYTLPVPLVVLP